MVYSYILLISNGVEEVRLDFKSEIRGIEFLIGKRLCQSEGGNLYIVIPKNSLYSVNIYQQYYSLEKALLETRERKKFYFFGNKISIPKSDLVFLLSEEKNIDLRPGYNVFYIFDKETHLETIREHYIWLKSIKILDDLACGCFNKGEIFNFKDLLFFGITSHDLEGLRIIPMRKTLLETKETVLKLLKEKMSISGIDINTYNL